jgi:hypothetical protein
VQMMAAARCKVSKWVFILGTLFGRQWDEVKLFYSAEEVSCAQQSAGVLLCWMCQRVQEEPQSSRQ